MTQTQALTTTNGTGVVGRSTTSATHAITPAPAAAQTMSALLTKGPHISDPIPAGPLKGYSRAMVDTIKNSVAKGAPDEQLFQYFALCVQYNLSPWLKECWCVDMGGTWLIAPSRDGYLRAAKRHPNFDQITSGIVREGDHYEIDPVNGVVIHRINGMQAKAGAILGAWCIVTTKDGKRYADHAILAEVKRSTPVWNNHPGQMVEKAAQAKVLKKAVGLSDLYTSDKVWETIDANESQALLVDPTQPEYFDGFVVGTVDPAPRQTPMLIDNGITDVPVPTNNGPAVSDAEYQHQKALDDLGTIITAVRKRIGAPAKETPANVKAMVSDLYGVADVRNLTTGQIADLSQRLTDTPTLLVQRPAVEPVTADDDDIPPFDGDPAPIDADEAARIAERERAEAEGQVA